MSVADEHGARRDLQHTTQLVAAACAYPGDSVDNRQYIQRCGFVPQGGWQAISEQSGIRRRRWCLPHENTRTLAEAALDRLLQGRPELLGEIDVIVVASGTTMNMAHPSDPNNPSFADLSSLMLKRLKLTRSLGLDIKACYCTGFLRGMQVVDGLLANANYRVAVLIASEQGSRFATSASNRSSFAFLVADGAGAVAFRRAEQSSRRGVLDYCGYTDASKLDWVGIGPGADSITMLGQRAAEATRYMLTECGRTLLRRNRMGPDDIDWFVPIQTHRELVDSVTAGLELPPRKLLWMADDIGFSGSASIPTCLAEHIDRGRIRPGETILSVAVGAGMNCAGALYRL